MVLCEELAGRAETTNLFYCRGRGLSPGTEESVGLVSLKGMVLVTRAFGAGPPADLPVLFGVLYDILVGDYHKQEVCDHG